MTTAVETLNALACRFDDLANVTQGHRSRAARKDASQLRQVAQLTLQGTYPSSDAWIWADAAAGQLTNDRGQLRKRTGRR